MIALFRKISLLEGLSLVLLFFVAMPLKYQFDMPQYVSVVGMTHGILFLVYVLMSVITSHKARWSVGFWLLTLLCSIVPFAFIWLDRRLKLQAAAQ